MKGNSKANMDAYISRFPPQVRAILQKIRLKIKKAAPRGEETISYKIPAFRLNGRMLIYFAAFKQHIGVYPPVRGNAALNKQLKPYRGEKGNLKFPLNERMPYGLITRVVKLRMRELEQGKKGAAKSTRAK